MDAKYHKAANVVSGCEANPNLDSLMKYKNDWGNQQHPWWGPVPNGTPDTGYLVVLGILNSREHCDWRITNFRMISL